MNSNNQISIAIPGDVMASCVNNATAIAAALKPYLQSLTESQRHNLFKLGDKSVGYLGKLLGYVDAAPQFAPGFMDLVEFKRDAQLVEDLQPLFQILTPLFSDINDTRMLAGSEAMSSGKMYYACVRSAAINNVPGAKAIYNDLNARFPGRKGATSGTNAAKAPKKPPTDGQ